MLLWLALACKGAPTDTGPAPICGGAQGEVPVLPRDGALRLNQVQAMGTHNSYHIAPDTLLDASHAYTLPPLDEQAALGVRQFELDVHRRNEGGFDVLHLPTIDPNTTCLAFEDCLCTLRSWSDAHPGHLPLVVWIEPKDELDDLSPDYRPMSGHLLELDDEIRAVFPPERLLAPDDVRGDAADLPSAIAARGWPTLGEARGKVLFAVLDTGAEREEYLSGSPNLAGRAMFVDNDALDDPSAAMFKLDDAIRDAAQIQAALDAGFIVTSNVDTPEDDDATNRAQFEASLAVGSQFLSTNFPAPVEGRDYWASIPGGSPAGCNPVTAPTDCAASDVEALP